MLWDHLVNRLWAMYFGKVFEGLWIPTRLGLWGRPSDPQALGYTSGGGKISAYLRAGKDVYFQAGFQLERLSGYFSVIVLLYYLFNGFF